MTVQVVRVNTDSCMFFCVNTSVNSVNLNFSVGKLYI